MKSERWFPISLATPTNAARFEVVLIETDYCGRQKKPLARFVADPAGDPLTALCREPDTYSRTFWQCELTLTDGRRLTRDVQAEKLSSGDLLILIVSARPEELDFLGGLNPEERGVVRVVPVADKAFPMRWQSLDSVDIVLLDAPPATLSAEQRRTLRDWALAGGTIIITDRGLGDAAEEPGDWLSEISASAGYTDIKPQVIEKIIGRQVDSVESIPAKSLRSEDGVPLFTADDQPVVVARDFGHGRVVASGINWRDLKLRNATAFEPVRRALWEGLLALSRPYQSPCLAREGVFPKEARVAFLVKPLGFFLLAYVLLLGPVNWLILRAVHRLEYSAFTLPLGALIFSVIAFLVGVSLRTFDTVLHEDQRLTVEGTAGFVVGVSGLLAPNTRPYAITARGGEMLLEEQVDRYGRGASERVSRQIPVHALTPSGPVMAGVQIQTWSMRFFRTRSPVELGGGVDVWASADASGIRGTVTNRLPFPIRDACIIHRWNCVRIGDISAGASAPFHLAIVPPTRTTMPRCPRCGGFHGGVWDEDFGKKEGLPEDLRKFLQRNRPETATVLIGRQDVPGTALTVDRSVVRSHRQRVLVIPVTLAFDQPDVRLPVGLVSSVSVTADKDLLKTPDCRTLPYRIALRDPAAVEQAAERRRRGADREFWDVHGSSDRREDISDFYLPFQARTLGGATLQIQWDAGEENPDYPPEEWVLSAYDWGARAWHELARAQTGEKTVEVPEAGPYVRLPSPVVRLKVATTNETVHRGGAVALELGCEVRRSNGS